MRTPTSRTHKADRPSTKVAPTDSADNGVGPGRPSHGLYPHISRTDLARTTGYHVSSIANILAGRTKVKLAQAVMIAKQVGISVEELSADLERQHVTWKSEQRKRKRRKSKVRVQST